MNDTRKPALLTKQDRLAAIFDAYYESHGPKPVRAPTVNRWAFYNGLYPIPARGCTIDEALAFEDRLRAATSKMYRLTIHPLNGPPVVTDYSSQADALEAFRLARDPAVNSMATLTKNGRGFHLTRWVSEIEDVPVS